MSRCGPLLSGTIRSPATWRPTWSATAALEQLRKAMPFPLRGVDTDNGGEFLNGTVATYCRAHDIPCPRSRPYHKNDQAWVEQKNGSVVRRLVGYRRLEGLAAAFALARLYTVARLMAWTTVSDATTARVRAVAE